MQKVRGGRLVSAQCNAAIQDDVDILQNFYAPVSWR